MRVTALIAIIARLQPAFTTVAGAVRSALSTNGIKGPYQGLSATIMRNIPANCVYLGTFEVLKRRAADAYGCTVPELPAAMVMGSAGLGGIMFWLTTYPVDVIKSAMMTDAIDPSQRKYGGIADAARKLYASGGIRRFYVGFTPCLIRAAPANATMLYTVDKVIQAMS